MSLRRRITLLAAAAVGVAVALAALVSYFAVDAGLRDGVDQALTEQATLVLSLPRGRDVPSQLPEPPRGGGSDFAQRVAADGTVIDVTSGSVDLPIDDRVRAVAAGSAQRFFTDVRAGDSHIRVLTFPLPVGDGDGPGGALQLGRSLDSNDAILARLRLILVVLCALGVGLASALGLLIGRRVVAPIRELSRTARLISRTQDLSRRIVLRQGDEVAELAAEFNAMLDTLRTSQQALDRSVTAQRQLVADASHELRTPVTTLRANIELLEHADALEPDDRAALLADLRDQAEELGDLVTDVIDLARGTEPAHVTEDVRLDALVQGAVARARAHAPRVDFRLDAEAVSVDGVPARLARAVNNLLDNAAKYGGPDGVVDVEVNTDGVTVRDHGEGIPPEDIDHVFDRFYRSAGARGRPGTGLGLAIVKQVAEMHGGSVEATNPTGRGARLRLTLPGRRIDEADNGADLAQSGTDRTSS